MELRFEAILYSNLGNKKSDADHIKCSRGPHLARWLQVPHPCPRWYREHLHRQESVLCVFIQFEPA